MPVNYFTGIPLFTFRSYFIHIFLMGSDPYFCYTTMQSLIKALRTEEIDRHAGVKMRRIRASNLLIIDEVGYLPINAAEGNMFFQLISELQERTSIIITTNKGFEEWTEFLGDAALATAILDRLVYQCDKIQMNGKSYRLENRKSFLEETA